MADESRPIMKSTMQLQPATRRAMIEALRGCRDIVVQLPGGVDLIIGGGDWLEVHVPEQITPGARLMIAAADPTEES